MLFFALLSFLKRHFFIKFFQTCILHQHPTSKNAILGSVMLEVAFFCFKPLFAPFIKKIALKRILVQKGIFASFSAFKKPFSKKRKKFPLDIYSYYIYRSSVIEFYNLEFRILKNKRVHTPPPLFFEKSSLFIQKPFCALHDLKQPFLNLPTASHSYKCHTMALKTILTTNPTSGIA